MDMQDLVKVALACATPAGGAIAWVWRTSRAHSKEMEAVRGRVTKLEADVASKPSADSVGDLRADIARLEGKIEVFIKTVFRGQG